MGVVLLVGGTDQWRSRTAALLARVALEAVGAASGAEALALAHQESPALVVLDADLPDIDGYEVCREFRDTFGQNLPIVMVSDDRNEPRDRTAALLIGADDYLPRTGDPAELLARVRRCLLRADRAGHLPVVEATESFRLTRRELNVLQLLAGGFNQSEIAGQLVISPKTVSSHVQRILAKLRVHSRAEAVALAHREGLAGDSSPRPRTR